MTSSHSSSLSPEELTKIEQDFDPEMSFRQFGPILTKISCYLFLGDYVDLSFLCVRIWFS